MATILIPTIARDVHAAAVALALEQLGHRPIRWFCADFPEQGSISMSPDADAAARLAVTDAQGLLFDTLPDIYWNRRLSAPVLGPGLPEGDRQFALRESHVLLSGALALASQHAFAVNDVHCAARTENKVLQLAAARELGFTLPDTLVSNDPARIRGFLRRHEKGGAIFKSFRPVTWESEDRLAMLFTARVDESMLPDDALLRLAPGIFQARVPKACELRITCMGDELIAARLDSQATDHGKTDWRVAELSELAIRPVELPADLQQRCRALLRRLGLVFGCIDVIVTPEGEHVFLEINQMGQFLWVEEMCPDVPMLQTFCEFLLSRDAGFRRRAGPARGPAYADVKRAALDLLEAEQGAHRQPEHDSHVVQE
jgi:hypothetical protein